MPFWESSVFWGIAGLVGGLIVSAFFFFIGKEKRLLEYTISPTKLITEKMADIPGIGITYYNQPVKNLTSTKIKFVNSGNRTIYPGDFATLEPLGITVTGHFLGDNSGYQISSDNSNSFPYLKVIDDKTLGIEFDFLKPKQSFSITILHGGVISVVGELTAGKMRAAKENERFQSKFTTVSATITGIICGLAPEYLEHSGSNFLFSCIALIILSIARPCLKNKSCTKRERVVR